jgi:Ion transport protein
LRRTPGVPFQSLFVIFSLSQQPKENTQWLHPDNVWLYSYIDGLRALGEVLLASFESFGAVSCLCLLFLTIFSILGLHLFGDIQLDIGFPNFSSFFDSFITVFQVCLHQLDCVPPKHTILAT